MNERVLPDPGSELERAGRLLTAWKEATAAGRGSIESDGQMIDEASVKMAEETIRRSQALTAPAAYRESKNRAENTARFWRGRNRKGSGVFSDGLNDLFNGFWTSASATSATSAAASNLGGCGESEPLWLRLLRPQSRGQRRERLLLQQLPWRRFLPDAGAQHEAFRCAR